MEPPENLLGASIPLHLHAFGAVVAEVTAHPNMDVGVVFAKGEAEGLGGEVVLEFCAGGEGTDGG